jgi:NAD(P)-dependent dehydrogenase (short-subunit alcohol dehydrogenase family)
VSCIGHRAQADMGGMVCVVTGGRVRIGYATVLKLLRAGATVVTTTRFPCDAALRYSREPDFGQWRHLLSVVGPLELSDILLVEAFCAALLQAHPRIHVLINNAAQTLTRPAGWYVRMDSLEDRAAAALPPEAQATLLAADTLRPSPAPRLQAPRRRAAVLLASPASTSSTSAFASTTTSSTSASYDSAGGAGGSGGTAVPSPPPTESPGGGVDALVTTHCGGHRTPPPPSAGTELCASPLRHTAELRLSDFPEGLLDESRQPLDLSGVNSWSRRLGEVETLEVVQTLAANAAAPFVLCNRLAKALRPPDGEGGEGATGGEGEGKGGATCGGARGVGGRSGGPCSHVINVTAVEGKFSVGKKSHAHPHTNMGKAALNMLTFTSAASFYQQYHVLMNSVDTGWVTDMAPGGVGVISARHATHVGPPLDEEDGAARVLDPIFSHLKDRTWRIRGHCFRNYYIAGW